MDRQKNELWQQGETLFHAMERLGNRIDKRIDEVNQQLAGVRSEMNQRLSDVHSEISKLNQNHIDHLTHHNTGG